MQNQPLWKRISAYPMPADSAGRSFVEQLREDQKISAKTALRGIEEYKRFLYLCATSNQRCVPTKAVDEVWHLHLGHTRDYWEKFVPTVLEGKAIHHTPGKTTGHRSDFATTLRRYREEFGEAPPKGIWQRQSLLGGLIGLVFTGAFTVIWITMGNSAGAPMPFIVFGGVLGCVGMYATASQVAQSQGWSIGLEVDIWADAEGGDCGDCGGGCGD